MSEPGAAPGAMNLAPRHTIQLSATSSLLPLSSPQSNLSDSSDPDPPTSLAEIIHNRCVVDPMGPVPGACLSKVTRDDRQGVSHFFGRNKTETASIDEDMFPILCRTHYQEKFYRFGKGEFAQFQCDLILMTLRKMAVKKLQDPQGREWPWWFGFELQLQAHKNSATPVKKKPTASAVNDGTAPAHRKHAPKQPNPVPGWLRNLITTEPGIEGERKSVRCDFDQLALVVNTMKTWCVQNNTKLPGIEAIPIPIGHFYESQIKAISASIRTAGTEKREVDQKVKRLVKLAEETPNPHNQRRVRRWEQRLVEQTAELAELVESKDRVERDAEETRETIVQKRITKAKVGGKKAAKNAQGKEMKEDVAVSDAERIPESSSVLEASDCSTVPLLMSSTRTTERRKLAEQTTGRKRKVDDMVDGVRGTEEDKGVRISDSTEMYTSLRWKDC